MPEKKTETKVLPKNVKDENLTLYQRFAQAQKEFAEVKMDKIGRVFYKTGPFDYPYASLNSVLDAIRPSMNRYGLVLTQDVSVDYSLKAQNGAIIPLIKCITACCYHNDIMTSSGVVIMAKDCSPQSVGAAITYSRRYDLAAFMGISAEEDSDAAPAQPEAGESMPVPTNTPPPPPANQQGKPDQIVVNGVVRYDRKSKQLNAAFQEANGLINDQQLHDIQRAVVGSLNTNFDRFQQWLRGKFGVEFYDIGADFYGKVLDTILNKPHKIMNLDYSDDDVQQSSL